MHRNTMLSLGGLVLLSLLSPSQAIAACYEQQTIESELGCSGSGGSSADFSGGCNYTEPQVIEVEVECPKQWVNSVGWDDTHEATCARAGLQPARNEAGKLCASGEIRPTSGEGWDSISYRYGKFGRGADGTGGKNIKYRAAYTRTQSNRDRTKYTVPAVTHCYNSGDLQDNDGSDVAVAFLCGP